MTTIALMNRKGGVGKTTTTINLAAQAALSRKTLVIDCDTQANLTSTYLDEIPETGFAQMLVREPFETPKVRKNLWLVPSLGNEMAGLDYHLVNDAAGHIRLKKALKEIANQYDICFLDCPPNLGKVTLNAMVAADYVIIPIEAAEFSMQGIDDMIEFLKMIITDELNPNLDVLGILLTMYDKRLNISKSIKKRLSDKGLEDLLFDTVIRVNTKVKEAQEAHKTIFEYDRKSHAAHDYMALGTEIEKKLKSIEK